MTVQSITSGQSGLNWGLAGGTDELGMDQFLSLLITQIKNQDPLSPMDNQQFISQLTQFTSLEMLQGVNSRLDENIFLTQSLNNTMLLGLVGRPVTVQGNQLTVSDGVVSKNQVQTSLGGTATVEVRDESNVLVATYTVPVSSGLTDITWDGLQSDGEPAPDGQYTLDIKLEDSAQNDVSFVPFMIGTVESIRFENNTAVVQVGGQDYYVSEILAVSM